MTTQAQREEHKKTSVLNGYLKMLATQDGRGLQSLQDKYPQYAKEFQALRSSC
jgi:predicted oxidoreductase (fatty acid repression mutant protein)